MLTVRFALLRLALVVVCGACSGAAPAATGDPTNTVVTTPTPTATPTLAIDHPAGATDVVLRMSTGGGFVAPGFLLTQVPGFTLYGDGTIVVRDPTKAPPAPVPDDGVGRGVTFRTARLTEDQVQELLAFAIGPGGLGIARQQYDPCCVADAPSTTFTLRADGTQKLVTVGALDFDETQPGPDTAARSAFRQLEARLREPDRFGVALAAYVPTAYRGILADGGGAPLAVPPRDWPWTFGPADFKAPADPNAFPSQTRTLTADEVAALKVSGTAGGAQSIGLRTTDGKVYVLSLRPLLPDEKR